MEMPSNRLALLIPGGGLLAVLCFFLPRFKISMGPEMNTIVSFKNGGLLSWFVLIAALIVVGAFFYYLKQNQIALIRRITIICAVISLVNLIVGFIMAKASSVALGALASALNKDISISVSMMPGFFGMVFGFGLALIGLKYLEAPTRFLTPMPTNTTVVLPSMFQRPSSSDAPPPEEPPHQ